MTSKMKSLEKLLFAGILASGIAVHAQESDYINNYGKTNGLRSYYEIENEYKRLKNFKDLDPLTIVVYDYYNFVEDRKRKDLFNYLKQDSVEYQTRFLDRAIENLEFLRIVDPNDVRVPARLALYNYLLGEENKVESYLKEMERIESLYEVNHDSLFVEAGELGDMMNMYIIMDKPKRAEFMADEYLRMIPYDPKDLINLFDHLGAESFLCIKKNNRIKDDESLRYEVEKHIQRISDIVKDAHKLFPYHYIIKEIDESFMSTKNKVENR